MYINISHMPTLSLSLSPLPSLLLSSIPSLPLLHPSFPLSLRIQCNIPELTLWQRYPGNSQDNVSQLVQHRQTPISLAGLQHCKATFIIERKITWLSHDSIWPHPPDIRRHPYHMCRHNAAPLPCHTQQWCWPAPGWLSGSPQWWSCLLSVYLPGTHAS